MADMRDVFDDVPLSEINNPRLSHSLDDGLESSDADAPAEFRAKSKRTAWYKNPEVVKGMVAGAVVLVLLLIVLIWQFDIFGGAEQSGTRAAAAQSASQAAPPTAPAPSSQPGVPPQPGPPPMPSVPPQPQLPAKSPPQPGSTAEKPPAEQKPPLPDDVANWKKDHYFRARREKDPKLLEAVAYLGETFSGKDTVAEGLTELLKPLPEEKTAEDEQAAKNPPGAPGVVQPGAAGGIQPGSPRISPRGAGMHPRNAGAMTGLVEAIVTALGNNGSDTARKTIEGILAGTFATDDDRTAVEAALKTLLAHPGKENDALLLRVLTEPKKLRPDDRQGPWPADELQAKAFGLTKESASAELRLALAEALVQRGVKLDPKDQMHEFLLAAKPINCEAQLLLYERASTSEELKTRLEEQFLGYGSLAMARCLGVPEKIEEQSTGGMAHAGVNPGGELLGGFDRPGERLAPPKVKPGAAAGVSPGGETEKSEQPELGKRLAAGLWSKKFLALLEPKLTVRAIDSLEKNPKLILLGGTIPHDSTRALLNELLRERWGDGPKALESAGLTGEIITDPGVLTVIKMLHRREPASYGGRAAIARRPIPTGGSKLIEEARKKQQTGEEWMELSRQLIAAWCKRFHAAAQVAQEEEGESASGGDAALKLPEGFELHPDARVVASYHLSWPAEAPAEVAALKPGLLEVYYVRVEQVSRPRKATAYYSRQAKLRFTDARTIDKKTIWLDSTRIGSQKDRRRSLDILITPPEHYVPPDNPRNEDETDLMIEILSVEIKDPTK